jgi:protein TonB
VRLRIIVAGIAFLIVLGPCAFPQGPPPSADSGKEPTRGEVLKVGRGISPPRAIYRPEPHYSKQARKAKLQGDCALWVVVGTDGNPRDIRVAQSLGLGLDEEAIKAVKQWKFEPAQKDGQPVAVDIQIQVSFHLY